MVHGGRRGFQVAFILHAARVISNSKQGVSFTQPRGTHVLWGKIPPIREAKFLRRRFAHLARGAKVAVRELTHLLRQAARVAREGAHLLRGRSNLARGLANLMRGEKITLRGGEFTLGEPAMQLRERAKTARAAGAD